MKRHFFDAHSIEAPRSCVTEKKKKETTIGSDWNILMLSIIATAIFENRFPCIHFPVEYVMEFSLGERGRVSSGCGCKRNIIQFHVTLYGLSAVASVFVTAYGKIVT